MVALELQLTDSKMYSDRLKVQLVRAWCGKLKGQVTFKVKLLLSASDQPVIAICEVWIPAVSCT